MAQWPDVVSLRDRRIPQGVRTHENAFRHSEARAVQSNLSRQGWIQTVRAGREDRRDDYVARRRRKAKRIGLSRRSLPTGRYVYKSRKLGNDMERSLMRLK